MLIYICIYETIYIYLSLLFPASAAVLPMQIQLCSEIVRLIMQVDSATGHVLLFIYGL